MEHGTHQFFAERRRSRRRLALTSAGLSLLGLGVIFALQVPPVSRRMRDIPVLRFGFEGPPRIVELLRVEARPGADETLRDVGAVQPQRARRGAGGESGKTRTTRTTAEKHLLTDPGEISGSLAARALADQGGTPVFQSDELVIDNLVKPIYPEEARSRGAEGRVAVLALVDTTGSVVEAEIVTASGEPQLDHAAEAAVLMCRFKPYRVQGEARQVYAVFRYRFTLQ